MPWTNKRDKQDVVSQVTAPNVVSSREWKPIQPPAATIASNIELRNQRLVDYQLRGLKRREIAELFGISRPTLVKWLSSPEYIKLHSETLKSSLETTLAGFNGAGEDGMQYIRDVILNPLLPTVDRLAASKFAVDKQIAFADALKLADSSTPVERFIPIVRAK
jgi:predicted DNA-binding protein (UPF0251 family)